MSDQRQNNTAEGPPGNHGNMNNHNNGGNPGVMPAGIAGAMQSGMPVGMAASMAASMAGMPAAMQAGMQSGIRSPVSQVQLIHSPLSAPPYLSQFPYNQQLMLQNAAVQAAMQAQAQMSQQFNLQAGLQGRPPSVSPKSPGIPVLSPSPSLQPPMSTGGTMNTSTMTTSSANNTGKSSNSKLGNNGNPNQATMMSGKATMIQRQAAAQPIVIGQIGMVPGQPVSTAGFFPQGCDPSQLINTQAQQLRLTNQQQLVTNTGQIFTSQPMLTNQAVLQAMASLQQQGIPIAHQSLLGTQTPSLIPGQPLYIRATGPMQAQQNMMAAAANVQTMNAMKNQKPMEAPTNLQTAKASSGMMARSPMSAQGRNFSTILPSTSRPGLSMAKVYPTNLSTQGQATKLNIPQVTPKLMKTKSRSHSSHKMPGTFVSSGNTTKVSASTIQAKPMSSTTGMPSNVARIAASKSPSESESDASKKASPSTPPTCTVSAVTEEPKSSPAYTKDMNGKAVTEKTVENPVLEKDMSSLPSERKEENMEVGEKLMPKKDVVVEKQKAIVKPHILTHVIEGFIIQEGPEPFPVQRSSLLTDFLPPKPLNAGTKDSEEDDSPYAFRDPTPDEMLNRPSISGSLSLPAGKCIRKRKHVLKMRKGWRSGRGGRLSFNISNSLPLEDNSSSRSEHESSSSVGSPPPPQETEMDMDQPSPQTSPSKWTVQDVYDFIKSITGCSTYAEEFKSQEIDGQALLLLKEDHLMTTMNMKLGPALKICARINSLKEDYV